MKRYFVAIFTLSVMLLSACGDQSTGPAGANNGPAGIVPTPASAAGALKDYAGDWKLDEAATVASMKRGKSEKQAADIDKMIASMRGMGMPVHADITVTGNSIIGRNAILQPQYDVLGAKIADGKTVTRVMFHEDRHDPGDAAEVDLSVWQTPTHLILEISDEGMTQQFHFVRAAGSK